MARWTRMMVVATVACWAVDAGAQTPPLPPPAPDAPPPVAPAETTAPLPEAPPPPPAAYAPPNGAPPPAYGYGPPPGYPPPGYGQPPPNYAPPPPAEDRTVRRHDGFYLRLGIGAAYGTVNSTGTLLSRDAEVTYKGAGPAYELLIGGTLKGTGLVIGGGFVRQDINDPEVSFDVGGVTSGSDTLTQNGTLGVVVLGPFVDWFFNETGGAHVGAMLGLGGVGLKGDDDQVSTGGGVGLWGGYDFWVGDQWSIGPEVRYVAVASERKILGETFKERSSSLELLFTALWH